MKLFRMVRYEINCYIEKKWFDAIDESELSDLKDQFDAIDVDKNGSISLEEMRQALAKDLPWKLKEPRVLEILQAADRQQHKWVSGFHRVCGSYITCASVGGT